MNLQPSTKAWWGRLGLLMFIMGIGGLISSNQSGNSYLELLFTFIGFSIALNVGWSKADHQ